ncbi:PilZ domain-containing protein [Sphingopyxis sp. MWB1]|uniref:PilZ domain-containing protein n=1 Tax=Sphingopyxis sp. MWB1 TaxID=1537715 RepID=UPI000689A9FC|nr:PilZ domain-containing protein [Sphingopyxis sp. MWB1]
MDSHGPEWLDEKVAALSRSSDRDSLFMKASMMLREDGRTFDVRVRNLSSGGMLAETDEKLNQSTAVEIELRNVGPVPGRIVWVGEGKCGIAFDRAVNPQAVRRQVVQKSDDIPPHLRRTGREISPLYRRR